MLHPAFPTLSIYCERSVIRIRICILIFVFLVFYSISNAGSYFLLDIGYVSNNIYKDINGVEQNESGIPLIGTGMGYVVNKNIFSLSFFTDIDFFCMDLFKENKKLVLFVKPHIFISSPFHIKTFAFSPLVGYGGIFQKRYIQERFYLSGENRYLEKANYNSETFNILFGVTASFSDWFKPLFICLNEPSIYYYGSILLRTPECEKTAPYIRMSYTGGKKVKTFLIGLTFPK